jgi:hypothetical protein
MLSCRVRYSNAQMNATEVLTYKDGTTESLGVQVVRVEGVRREAALSSFSEVITVDEGGCGIGQAALGALKSPELDDEDDGQAEEESNGSRAPVPLQYLQETPSYGCAFSALTKRRLEGPTHDWRMEQLLLDFRGAGYGFSIADPLYSGTGCTSLVDSVHFEAAKKPRSFVT